MNPQIMIDLETLGVSNTAAILSIGAVKFTETEILDKFYVRIDPATCQRAGLKIDASTVMWWMSHDREQARANLLESEMIDLPDALIGFSQWCGDDEVVIWGNGATFDNVILRSAYAACGLEYPAKYSNDRCFRTLKGLAPQIETPRDGVHHDALDDALHQAKHMQAVLAHLRSSAPVLPASGPDPVTLLAKAGRQFRMYQEQHEAKTRDISLTLEARISAEAKADVNRQLAEEIEQLLGAVA